MPWMHLTAAILMLALTACQTTTLAQKWQLPSEDVSFQGHEKRYGSRIIPAELHFPQQTKGKLPLIISQHGSSRDGGSIMMWNVQVTNIICYILRVCVNLY